MRVENQPYGRLSEIIYDQAFTVHPYKHPTIGTMEDLEAASVEDVRDFYRTYYVPANATLVIVGDFDAATPPNLSTGTSAACRSPRPGAARHPAEPPRDIAAARRRSRRTGRCRSSWWRTTSPSTATRTRTRCTSRRRSCRTGRARGSTGSSSTRPGSRCRPSAAATSSSIRTCSSPSRSCSRATPRTRPSRRWSRELDRLRPSRSPSANCSARRTSSRATTSSGASRTSRRRARSRTPR